MDAGGQARKRPLDAGGTPVSPPGMLLITCRQGAAGSSPDPKVRRGMGTALDLLHPLVTKVVVRACRPGQSPVETPFSLGGEPSGDRAPRVFDATEKLAEALAAWGMVDTRCHVSWCTCDPPEEDCGCQGGDDEALALNLLGARCPADLPEAIVLPSTSHGGARGIPRPLIAFLARSDTTSAWS